MYLFSSIMKGEARVEGGIGFQFWRHRKLGVGMLPSLSSQEVKTVSLSQKEKGQPPF